MGGMTRTRPDTLRWLLVATVVEVVCVLVLWLPLLRGLDQWLDFAWPGLLLRVLAVAVVPVLMYAVWREQAGHTVVTQESADLMVAVLSTSREWLWAVDLAGVFTFCRASRELVGYEASELLGQPCNVVMDLSELARARSEMQALGGPESGWAGLVVRCRHRDGSTIWVESAGRPRNDRAGRIIGFEGTNRPLGREAVHTVATERTKARVEAMLGQRLLLTAFQPICDLKNGGVVGVEALTRFVAEPGVTPDVWFAEAGSVGLGIELELLLAVQTALETAALLPGRLYVSVNVSPSACLDPRLAGLLEQCPIVTGRIVLELTEHAAVTNYEPLTAALASLRRVGVRIAVDDAGAGYASFRHILRLKPDLIKLDRDIVAGIDTDPARHALGAAVVTFAAQIGARVIAEGIQTSAELATVTGLGMTGGQGYLLGRPSIEARDFQCWQPATHSRRQAAI
jgi:PAS domain S-box-containing protein